MSFRRGILDVSRNGEGGPHYHFTEAVSLFVRVEGQAEVDRLWDRLIEGRGEPSRCGWLKDKYGLSWQVIPTALYELIGDPDPARAGRAMQAMRFRRCPAGPRSTSLRPGTASRPLDLAVTRAAGAGCGMDTGAVMAWVAQYEQAWRDDEPQEYRDLWILRFDGDGRVQHFEEWAYWPDKPFMAAATDDAAAPPAD